MRKRDLITKAYRTVLCALIVFVMTPITVKSNIQTQAAIDRKYELIEQGYSGEVVYDQLKEEFDHVDGKYGTGGIDGLKLDGTPASVCSLLHPHILILGLQKLSRMQPVLKRVK